MQELTELAVELCGADSAGISIERENPTDDDYFRWIAAAGEYSAFLDASLPRYPSACSICLERDHPQLFRVGKRFFDILGVTAPPVTDGLLLPWNTEKTRGTIFVMAHGRREAFNQDDCELMQTLAGFAAMGMRHREQHQLLVEQAGATAAAAMANELAHRINNPLQGLTNQLYLAASGSYGEEARRLGEEASVELARLSALVQELLTLPGLDPRKLRT
ncbi:MAG: GAF domain-containing protein [Silvibacterium sp.]